MKYFSGDTEQELEKQAKNNNNNKTKENVCGPCGSGEGLL